MRLFLLGLPGAGKGTQAKTLAERHRLLHISSGDMFRDAAAEGTEFGAQAQAYMSRGELVPDEVTIAMLLERIDRPDAKAGFILDGFPRTIAQAEALDRALAGRGGAIDAVLYIQVPEQELIIRLSGRWSCPGCGAIYHERYSPPRRERVCDQCGGALTQREDDRAETIGRRLRENRERTDQLADHYARADTLHAIDGTGEPADVAARLQQALDDVFAAARKA